jgi:deoxyadenosine/deoxycytidine kinase
MDILKELMEQLEDIFFRKPEKYIAIEGNIGSGKSTLIENLNDVLQKYSRSLIQEPVKSWQMFSEKNLESDIETNILDNFYKDKKRWAYTMQSVAFLTRTYWLMNSSSVEIKLSERSIFTDYDIFGKMCYENKDMSEIEKQIYDFWFKWLLKLSKETKYKIEPDAFIYLKTSPEKCFERIQKRGREEEKEVTLEYITKVHEYHENFIEKLYNNNIPVLVLDGDIDNENKHDIYQQYAHEIEDFYENLK